MQGSKDDDAGQVDDYYGESLATVIAGKLEIHIKNQRHSERISAWLQEDR